MPTKAGFPAFVTDERSTRFQIRNKDISCNKVEINRNEKYKHDFTETYR